MSKMNSDKVSNWLIYLSHGMRFMHGVWQAVAQSKRVFQAPENSVSWKGPIIEEIIERPSMNIIPGTISIVDPLNVGSMSLFQDIIEFGKNLKETNIISSLLEEEITGLKKLSGLTSGFLLNSQKGFHALKQVVEGITNMDSNDNALKMGGNFLKEIAAPLLLIPEVGILLSGGSYALGTFLDHLGEQEDVSHLRSRMLSVRHGVFSNICSTAYAENVHKDLKNLSSLNEKVLHLEKWIIGLHHRMVDNEKNILASKSKSHGLQFWSFEKNKNFLGIVSLLGVNGGMCQVLLLDLMSNIGTLVEFKLVGTVDYTIYDKLKALFSVKVRNLDLNPGYLVMYATCPCFAPDWIIYRRVSDLKSKIKNLIGDPEYKRSICFGFLQNGDFRD